MAPLDRAASFPEQLPDAAPMPAHFLLLRIAISQVVMVEFREHHHHRRRWQAVAGWAEENLNP